MLCDLSSQLREEEQLEATRQILRVFLLLGLKKIESKATRECPNFCFLLQNCQLLLHSNIFWDVQIGYFCTRFAKAVLKILVHNK